MRTIERLADQVFAPTGMKPAYAYIMMTLEDRHPLTIMEIAHQLGYERSSISRMVRALAKRQLVQLTSRGRETLVELAAGSSEFLTTANECLEQFGRLTDQYLARLKRP
ncbi:MarR family winged helix-turn-helix transcriptional regulator [Lacticaseibacillus thailandensis]|uniref:MarR family winged helix-turn-helix transcriptional regulator n=1 Tax=Lacticaseibacillus thailandensis TaxID=381741 RepID=UPI0006D09BD2|nr:helix-turn-helix domain-containing protein [Lacticaseibacillus thailandensis]